jgi:hypothetical protein
VRKLPVKFHLEDQKRGERVKLRFILGKCVVGMEYACNWLGMVSSGWLWY